MQGARYPDVPDATEMHDRMGPGGYRKTRYGDGPWIWEVCDPHGNLGTIRKHTVEEHEDGTITVTPSIYDDSPGGYHGHLVRGVWDP